MRRSIQMLGVAVLVAAPLVVAVGAPAGAETARPFSVSIVSAAAGPNSNLVPSTAHGRPRFTPTSLNVEPTSRKHCTPAHGGATVTNRTKATQTITYNGKVIVTVAPKKIALFCGAGPSHVTYGVDGSQSTLTINFA